MKKILLLLMMVNLGCATILQPGPDRINVNTNPPDARVYLNEQIICHSPCVVNVNRSDNFRIKIEKDGYETYNLDRQKVVSGWIFGNIILGGLIGVAVDLITSNQGHYPNDPVFTELHEKEASRPPASAAAQ